MTCCQEIAASGKARVTLIAPGGLLKGAKNVVKLTRRLETFDGEAALVWTYTRTSLGADEIFVCAQWRRPRLTRSGGS